MSSKSSSAARASRTPGRDPASLPQIVGVLAILTCQSCGIPGGVLIAWFHAVQLQGFGKNGQLGSASDLGFVFQLAAGDLHERRTVQLAADTPRLNQCVIDVPQHQRRISHNF